MAPHVADNEQELPVAAAKTSALELGAVEVAVTQPPAVHHPLTLPRAPESSEIGTPPDSQDLDSAPYVARLDAAHFAMLQQHSHSTLSTPRTPPTDDDGSARGFLALGSPASAPPTSHRVPYSPRSERNAVSSTGRDGGEDPAAGRGSGLGPGGRKRMTFVSQRNVSRESAQELARQALNHRKVSVGDVTFDNPRESNLRESVRRVHAYSRREVPIEHELTAEMFFKRRACEVSMDREAIEWRRGHRVLGRLETDDIVAARNAQDKPGVLRIHYFERGRGGPEKALRRRHRYLDFTCEPHVADKWITAIQELVRWQARAPPIAEKRRIKIVVNPHSGKRRARTIWANEVRHFFDWGNFDYVVEETTYGGHAIDMGKQYSADDGFEALIFIGGDGTLCEFMNGLLSRPEPEWREIVATTPISLISAGTQNAFGVGVGIPTVEAAVYCIIKRKIRPLDVITAVADQEPSQVHYSYCGLGWGIAGDIAAESERYRWLGTSRYAFLKLKRSLVLPKRHTGRIRWVGSDPEPPLRKYFDIRDVGALDQFEMEEGNVYDLERSPSVASVASASGRKSWAGAGGAVRSPASHKRYPEAAWREERGRFMVVGVLNAAPDALYAHPSDGHLDLIISRKGNLWRQLQLGILYLFGQELKSPLLSYRKVKAVVIEQDQPEHCMNIDGEVLPGPGPWRMEVVPSLFKALSEK